jgi:hypothetical protein
MGGLIRGLIRRLIRSLGHNPNCPRRTNHLPSWPSGFLIGK